MKKSKLRCIFDSLIRSMAFRRLASRPVTWLRSSERMRKVLHQFGSTGDVWANSKKIDEFLCLRERYTVNFKKHLKDDHEKTIGLISLPEADIYKSFFKACETLNIKGVAFDPSEVNFIQKIRDANIKTFLCRPCHDTALMRLMFKEKINAIFNLPGKQFYPNAIEQRLYEAKRELAYFLEAENIPHPQTNVFYKKNQALDYISQCAFPQVFKTHNGAGSFGVEIIHNRKKAEYFIKETFDRYYINKALSDYRDIDYGYILLQEFIEDAREFRIIKIGDSWFGHEKFKEEHQEFMSGSGVNKWTPPPHDLLDFCAQMAQKHGFETMCFDIFLNKQGQYLVNELQTWFGSYNPSQMYIDNIPGRYRKIRNSWVFEEGLFNDVESMTLRLVNLLNK